MELPAIGFKNSNWHPLATVGDDVTVGDRNLQQGSMRNEGWAQSIFFFDGAIH